MKTTASDNYERPQDHSFSEKLMKMTAPDNHERTQDHFFSEKLAAGPRDRPPHEREPIMI